MKRILAMLVLYVLPSTCLAEPFAYLHKVNAAVDFERPMETMVEIQFFMRMSDHSCNGNHYTVYLWYKAKPYAGYDFKNASISDLRMVPKSFELEEAFSRAGVPRGLVHVKGVDEFTLEFVSPKNGTLSDAPLDIYDRNDRVTAGTNIPICVEKSR